MKVILSKDVPNLGRAGETVNVADGYARNFLMPRQMAVSAHSGSAKQLEHQRRVIQLREEKRRGRMAEIAGNIGGLTIEFAMHSGTEDKIFGSVTAAHIAERLHELGYDVDRKAVRLHEPIKTLGVFVVPLELTADITAEVTVWVSSLDRDESIESVEEVVEQASAAAEVSAAE